MLTQTRKDRASQTMSLYSRRKRHFSPLPLISLCITVLLIVSGTAVFVLSRAKSHAAAANPNCTLIVPANPLSAQGLATPYQLAAVDNNGPCNEANANQSAFVQGVIYDPANGTFSVYSPLVIDKGTQPAVQPTVPTLPANAVVGLWFGFNGTNLTLKGTQRNVLAQGNCVNGTSGSVFGQFAYCNASAFFTAANNGQAQGKFTIPPIGIANDGMSCMTSRDFGLIDQDQSDNVQTQYLANGQGQIAQFSAANQQQFANATAISNPSDNALLTHFVDPVLGCTPWQAPDLANNGAMVSALPLDEIQAAADQKAPIALVPLTDPMVLHNANQSLRKTNLYRLGVDQTQASSTNQASGTTYCQNFATTGLARLKLDQTLMQNAASPMPAAANSLFTFLAQRFNASYTNLNCQKLLHQPNPVTVQTDGNGVAIGATFGNGNNGNGNQGNGNQGNGNGKHGKHGKHGDTTNDATANGITTNGTPTNTTPTNTTPTNGTPTTNTTTTNGTNAGGGNQ
ncbi:hypothetical protein ccbrp13_67650 [Ktedonobacteria bacterium brp13]|nr:hypothetical protein ccbrp13_67650 [Ktedonobacteria bacterium brp13]